MAQERIWNDVPRRRAIQQLSFMPASDHNDSIMSQCTTESEGEESELVFHTEQPAGGFVNASQHEDTSVRPGNWLEWYTTFPRLYRTAASTSAELPQIMASDSPFRTANGLTICSSYILLEEFYNMPNGSRVATEFLRLARLLGVPIIWEKAAGYRGLRINDTNYLRIRGNLARILGINHP